MARVLGTLLASLDAAGSSLAALPGRLRDLLDHPRVGDLLATLIIGVASLVVCLEEVARWLDAAFAAAEKAFVSVALLVMTLLAADEYFAREAGHWLGLEGRGLLAESGQMNLALLLMVLVGFLGASLATRERKHIAIDAAERALSAPSALFVRRFVAAASALLCATFARASWRGVEEHARDAFEGVLVAPWMVAPINALLQALPGDRFGPGTPFPSLEKWEEAQWEAGGDPMEALAFGVVQAGDRFPLWVPVLFLAAAFGLMSLRFAGRIWAPGAIDSAPSSAPSRRPADILLAGALPGGLLFLALGWWAGTGWLILLSSIGLVLLGAPLFVALGVGTLASWILLRGGSAHSVVSDMFEATKKQELLAIPFFVLAGNLMTRGSIASRLIEVARALVGGLPGGLGVAAVTACALFAAISGSSPVTVIAIGTILYPLLTREGYGSRYAVGVLTTAGGLGIIIPPSIPMIVYAIMVSGSPGVGAIDPARLFKAGILPGLLIAGVLSVHAMLRSWPRDGAVRYFPDGPAAYGQNLARAVLRGIPSLLLPALILGGIYGWLDLSPLGLDLALRFTVTEAAAVAVVYALLVELTLHRELRWRDLPEVFSESAMMMGSLFLILVIAISLNRFFVFEELPEAATAWMMSKVSSKLTFLIMVNLFLLALGMVMDILSAILIVAPLLAPIAARYGIDPIHFAIMFIVNLELGYLTPPMGINLFVATTVFRQPLMEVIRSVLPFLGLMLLCLLLIILFPGLSLWLIN